jgi:hypothetical protein
MGIGEGMGAGSTFAQGANTNTANPFSGDTNPYLQAANATTLGNLAGAQVATQANRVNQNTPYANLNYTQNADGTWTANQTLAQPLQSALGNISNNVANTTATPFSDANTQNQLLNTPSPQFQQAGQAQQAQGVGSAPTLQTQIGGTGTQGWDAATQMIMNRLQPQMAQQAESQKAALANQGIVPGTQAYDNAMRTFQQGQNDLLTSAQMQGANLQNQLFNQNLSAGNFTNSALTGQNAMNLSNTQLGNQAAQQNYTNQLAGLGLNNQYAQQGFANAVTGQQANNAALQNNYTQNLAAYNNPLQQLGAFQSGTTPGYVNPYSQAAVSGPDYLGAYTTSNAANIAAQNAANAKTANLQNGLFGLGSSAILGAGGIGNLGTSILNGATTLGGLLGLGNTPDISNISTADWMSGNF